MTSTSSPPELQILNVHNPTSSYAIIHSLQQETHSSLISKISKKEAPGGHNAAVGPGWIKYEWNEGIWNLDDGSFIISNILRLETKSRSYLDSDYAIFVWRFTSLPAPTLHVRNPSNPLPSPASDT